MIYDRTLYTYLAPSKICDGVGVFSLVDIPKDTIIFPESKGPIDRKVLWTEVDSSAHKQLRSLCQHDDEGFYIDCDINRIDIAYYVNHSRTPNVYFDKSTYDLFAMDDIRAKEELTQFYPPYERDW